MVMHARGAPFNPIMPYASPSPSGYPFSIRSPHVPHSYRRTVCFNDVLAVGFCYIILYYTWYRRVRKEDMRRIAKTTGASIVTTLADMEGNESFDAEMLGEAEEVSMNGDEVWDRNPRWS